MSSPSHAMPEPTGIWSDPVSTSGTFTRVPALVPRGGTSLFLFDQDGSAAGFVTQTQADVDDFIRSVLDPLDWLPTPWSLTSDQCSHPDAYDWPDGTPGQLFCSLPIDHAGLHEPKDTRGNVMPRPLDDLEAAA
jgi:hypothetical protein